MSISELQVEDFLRASVKARGGLSIKLGMNGWPDQVIALPRGRIGFLELKRPGEEPELLQWDRLSELKARGAIAEYANTYAMVESFVKRLAQEPH